MKSKKCTKCGEVKSLSMFGLKFDKRSGKTSNRCWCKCCVNEYRSKNKEKIAAYGREYASKNKEKLKIYRAKNKEKIAAYGREYASKNKEKTAAYGREYASKNKEKIAARTKIYRAKNKEKIAARNRECCKNMTDRYIIELFKMTADQVPHELIEAKRAQLKLYRATK